MVIYLQIPTTFWTDGRITSVSYQICMMLMIIGSQMYTVEPLVPEPSCFDVEISV